MKTDDKRYDELITPVTEFVKKHNMTAVDITSMTIALSTGLYIEGTRDHGGSPDNLCMVVRHTYNVMEKTFAELHARSAN